MKIIKFMLALLSITLAGHQGIYAQHLLGISNSNYAGTHGITANPSYAADSRHGFYFNLVSVNAYASNTHYSWDGPSSLPKFFMNGEEWEEDYIKASDTDEPALFNVGADIRGPSFLLKLNAKSGLGVHTRVRGSVQANNVSPNITQLLKTGISRDEWENQPFLDNAFALNANVISEVGMTYARTVWESGQHFLKAGFTAKKLFGTYSVHMAGDAMDYNIRKNQNLNYFMEVDAISAQYGFSTSQHFEDIMDPQNAESWGRGWGFDLGFTYEHRPNVDQYQYTVDGVERLDNSKNKYNYKIGLSILDIGGINYDSPLSRMYAFERANKIISESHLNNLESDFVGVVNEVFDVRPEEGRQSFRSGLPTALKVDLDVKLAKKIYTSLTVLQDLKGKEGTGMRQNSMVAVTPRIEMRGFELAVPVSLSNNYQTLGLGSFIKLGPLLLGSDNLANVLGIGKAYGADVYMGLAFPFSKGKKKDVDHN